ncbi:polymorphic toxin-type HINT domain-containing protein [Gimesia maris]|uniref:Intein C-terminal splicing domain-containing protein n=1 Tax=Gimesia maris TaxID=122 RepID=A0ABX5YNM9_9PLAN|nr:polymorphic toxin-type HINT domain-containing protein [Gimesia maris]EDL62241.1 hypothetical protein PM8797T_27974 [Gimesia maris DSM 8797]QEG17354.1 hypothetical protein GmarT_32340 [Gimesia maris]
MSDITRKIAIFSCMLLTSFCFWKAGTGLISGADASVLPSAQATLSPGATSKRVVTTPIQQMRPGMRVVGRNPLRLETESTIDPTPEGWRLVSVRMRKEDGTYFEAELLRPLSWISRHRAKPGAVIELNMPELHVVGAAEVLAVSACPPIDPGDGPVVLSTFKNVAKNVLNIYVEGETEPIGVTAGHPIWSEDRQAFVHSEKLQPGERLRSALGKTVRITSIEIRAGPEPVYNLEVAGEHVYSVTDSGLLVHNTGPCDLNPPINNTQRIASIRDALTDTNGRLLSRAERQGIKFAIRRVESQGFRLDGTAKINGNQGIDLTFSGTGNNAGRFALAEAKSSPGLGSLSRDSLGIRQGSFDFFQTRLERGGRTDLLLQLESGNVDLFGGFQRSGRLFQFDPEIFIRDVNFRTTPGAANLIP